MTCYPPGTLLKLLAMNAAVFGGVALVFWGIEALWNKFVPRASCLVHRGRHEAQGTRHEAQDTRHEARSTRHAISTVLRHMPWILGGAIALALGMQGLAKLFGWDMPQQDMLLWLTGDYYSVWIKAVIVAYAVIEAPLLEELVFRRFIFRALRRAVPFWCAAAISALLFAASHMTALVFIPLVFVGYSFAWLYQRTGRIIAPMFAHFLFNSANVVLLFLMPEV